METFHDAITSARQIAQASGEERKKQPAYGRFLKQYVTIYISYFLARAGIRANWVTISMALCCAAAGFCFFPRNIYANIAGIVLMHVMYILDIVDGEVARLRKETSILGVYLDYVAHQIANPIFALGYGMHLYILDGTYYSLVMTLLLYSAIHWQRGLASGARATLFVTGYRPVSAKNYKGLTDWKRENAARSLKRSIARKAVTAVAHSIFTIPTITLIGLSLVASYFVGTGILYVVLTLYTGVVTLATLGMVFRDARAIGRLATEQETETPHMSRAGSDGDS
jgi:phosphatidylglycerophosphate synthase